MSIEEAYVKWADELARYAVVLVGRDDAADVVSDAFAGLLRRGSAAWAEIRDPRRFLFTVVLNESRSRLRSRSRRLRRDTTLWEPDRAADVTIDPSVLRAVGRLTVQQRAVIYLAYWEDMTSSAIGEVLGVSDGTAKRQLARARARLREVLL